MDDFSTGLLSTMQEHLFEVALVSSLVLYFFTLFKCRTSKNTYKLLNLSKNEDCAIND